MTAKAPGRTANVTPVFGVNPIDGYRYGTASYGVRGFRAHCPECGYLHPSPPEATLNYRTAQSHAQKHRCKR